MNDEYEPIAAYYDHVVAYATRADVDFYVQASRAANGPTLEIGCGTGRILIPTLKAGVNIIGFDDSQAMLDRCAKQLANEGLEARLIRGDMRSFDLGERFALITLPFRPFQHLLTVEDQLACLACVHRHLTPAGRLVFDIFNPHLPALTQEVTGEELPEEGAATLPDGSELTRTSRIIRRDLFNQITDGELIYCVRHSDGVMERHVQAFRMRWLYRFEAEHLLVRAGFRIEAVYGDFQKSPYGTTYPGELIFVAGRA